MKAAFYCRVSKDDKSQDPVNQVGPLRKWATSLNYEVVKEYIEFVSGGNSNRPQFKEMMESARRREFDIILVWSLDRFSREGISNTMHYLEELRKNGVGIKSLQESWLDTSDEGMGHLLIAIFSWVAKQERLRISERTKAGLQIARMKLSKEGRKLGRPVGAKDKNKRRISGYIVRQYNLKQEQKELSVA